MPQVTSDTFPANVTFPDGTTTERNRVITTPDRIMIYRDSSTGPTLAYDQPISDLTPSPQPTRLRELYNRPPNSATLSDGSGTVTWYRGAGCGCGSRLKTFNPFRTLTATPRQAQAGGTT